MISIILPFFAAVLALELGAVFQIAGHLPPARTGPWPVSICCIVAAGVSTLTALGFFAASIFPAKLAYIAIEPELLNYAVGLDEDELQGANRGDATAVNAVVALKRLLARQYADASYYNRGINRRRCLLRSIAGLATVVGLLSIIALVASTMAYYV